MSTQRRANLAVSALVFIASMLLLTLAIQLFVINPNIQRTQNELRRVEVSNFRNVYRGQIASCRRVNVLRAAVYKFAIDAGRIRASQARETTGAARATNLRASAQFFAAGAELSRANGAGPKGLIRCPEVIQKP